MVGVFHWQPTRLLRSAVLRLQTFRSLSLREVSNAVFENDFFDPETLALMAKAYEAAAAELGQTPKADQTPEQRVALDELVTRITAAAEAGERLKTAALGFTLTAPEKT